MPLPLYYFDADGWYTSQGFSVTEYERMQRLATNPRTTVTAPPEAGPGERARRVDGQWVLEAWPPVRSPEAARGLAIAQAKAMRDAGIRSGFTWNGLRFDSDMVSQQRIASLAMLAGSPAYPAEGIGWRLADNTWTTLSAADAQALFATGAAHVQAWFAAFAAHEAALLALTDVAAIDAYDLAQGWPNH